MPTRSIDIDERVSFGHGCSIVMSSHKNQVSKARSRAAKRDGEEPSPCVKLDRGSLTPCTYHIRYQGFCLSSLFCHIAAKP